MPNPDGSPTEAEYLEGRYPGAEEEHERGRDTEAEIEESAEQRVVVVTQDEDTGEILSAMHMGPGADYVVVLGPNYYIAAEQLYPGTGTTQLTIKRRRDG